MLGRNVLLAVILTLKTGRVYYRKAVSSKKQDLEKKLGGHKIEITPDHGMYDRFISQVRMLNDRRNAPLYGGCLSSRRNP
jgi:hypothetical protein